MKLFCVLYIIALGHITVGDDLSDKSKNRPLSSLVLDPRSETKHLANLPDVLDCSHIQR
ncbi:hypothetical protein Pmar_PMAR004225 [Perkinsus marinus ATCC 50983]|uniref:Uncharacterized protein n=1 Tax=Perkinsus marinus (strain ATCC 50983 / TXsc) TaxID=423536 RepID=C5LPN2_PERM5|nr:hypothetical protein Pmar_PMAR004225 [Perkinsus marinus ATCC 50983]EER01352.1 hypothetical protein Pmar_PMAR004225 [Perkinsus marinus ATCC 50983]|eukprot:XP_002768634.1 hypothetical protein Pmar_PMAR004225 [Perkinsus marinus ATCC 50983]